MYRPFSFLPVLFRPVLVRGLVTFTVALTSVPFLASAANAIPSIGVYISAPDINAAPSSFSGLTTETFDALPTGNQTTPYSFTYNGGASTATYSSSVSSPFAVVANDQYGNGTGNYFAIGAQSNSSNPISLTFSTPIAYFGMAYDAGDSLNGMTFYDSSDNVIGRFSTATLVTLLNNGVGTIRAENGNTYNTSAYFGNPVTGQNSSQPYAFLDFFAYGGTISKVVLDNSGSRSTGFESDNHTVSVGTQTPTGGDFIAVGGTISNLGVGAPEPGALLLVGFAGLPVLGFLRVARRKS